MYGKQQQFSLHTHHSMSSTKSLRSIEALRSTLRQHSYFFLQYSLTDVSTNRLDGLDTSTVTQVAHLSPLLNQ